nr:S24 family peptidase [uncultured Gemmiger sp.]
MSIADNIKRLRLENGLSQAEFGKIAGVTDKAVSTWESGIKVPRMGAVEKIAAHFGILKSAILDDFSLPSNAIPVGPGPQIPILGSVRCGQPMYAEGNIDGYVPYLGNSGETYFALRAIGDSMNAAGINEGDLVIVRQQESVDQNTIAVVCVNDDEATLKRFRQDGNTVFLIPQSTNPNHQVQVYDITRTPVHIIGRVMEIRKQL